jgi:hypothetical protein
VTVAEHRAVAAAATMNQAVAAVATTNPATAATTNQAVADAATTNPPLATAAATRSQAVAAASTRNPEVSWGGGSACTTLMTLLAMKTQSQPLNILICIGDNCRSRSQVCMQKMSLSVYVCKDVSKCSIQASC